MDADLTEEIKQLSFVKKRIAKEQMDMEEEEGEAVEITRKTPKYYDQLAIIHNVDTYNKDAYNNIFVCFTISYMDAEDNVKVTF